MPANTSKDRVISYTRAAWPEFSAPPTTLQQALSGCLNQMAENMTKLPLRSGHAQVRHWSELAGELRIHIAAWTDGESVSTVPSDQLSMHLGEEPPGTDWEYLDGDGMVLVRDNHCLLMPSGLQAGTIEQYLRNLLAHGLDRGAPIHSDAGRFELVAIANSSLVSKVLSQGVKGLNLNLGLHAETVREMQVESQTIARRIGRMVLETLIESDEDLRKIEEADNVQARLVVRIDSRKPGVAAEDLASIGQQVASESGGEVEIETKGGQRYRRGELALRKKVRVEAFAKTVHHNDAWEQMSTYLRELSSSGTLDSSGA